MVRTRSLTALVGVTAAGVALAMAVPVLRRSLAQDVAPGTAQPAILFALPAEQPELQPPPVRLAQLPAAAAEPQVIDATPEPLPTPAATATTSTSTANPSADTSAALPAGEERMQLRTLSAEQLHRRLQQIFGREAPPLAADGSGWIRFTVDAGDGSPVLVAAHAQTAEVRVVGRAEQLNAWRQIIAALDASPVADQATEVVAADEAAVPQIQRAVNMLLAQAQVPAGQNAGAPPSDAADPGPDAGELLGPVEIVNVEGTELFVVRGNPRDVARVMEVIRQIEDMSRVSAPEIVVHALNNVDSQATALVLQQLFAAADEGSFSLGTYYGRLLALPLGRPNAVLLVGAPGTITKAEEILDQLDVATQPTSTLFEVFRLKYANAAQAQTVVTEMFTAMENDEALPASFGPKALVIPEPRINALIVRASPSDMAEVRELVKKLDAPGGENVNELRVFKLRHSLAATLAPVLQRAVRGEGTGTNATTDGLATLLKMVTIDAQGQQTLASGVLAGVTVNADTRANALVVSAPPDSMPLMTALIEQLDQPPDAVAELKVFTIKNGDAVTLADMLGELFGAPQNQGGGGGGGGGGGAEANASVFQLRFSVDERTNSIIAAGSADELLVVEAILLRLDAGESRSRVNKVYRLKNASAQGVALALQDWLERKRDIEQTGPVDSPFSQIEREVVVVAEIASNSLIVSATPVYYQELEGIIQQLDEQAPMVMIQVLIGEIRIGDADEFGVELGLQDSVLFDRSLLGDISNITTTTQTQSPGGAVTNVTQQVVQTATLTPGYNFGNPSTGLPNSGSASSLATAGAVGAQGLSSFAVNRVSPDLGFGGFVLAASSDSVSALLRALQESRRIEVLSRPQIMALDNQFGRAFVGEIVPLITSSNITQFGQTQNQVTPTPVGLELFVRPRISPDDLVVMEVSAAKRELGPLDQGVPVAISPDGEPINVPRIASTEAQTTISAVSGQTVVLSGLLTKRDEALHRRVPLLADIPLVGALFRFDSSRQVRTELLIVLTPHVIRSRADAERIKQIESSRMSWCLSDVVDLHGAAGLRSRGDMLGAAEAEVIMPDTTPADMSGMAPLIDAESLPLPDGAYPAVPAQPVPWQPPVQPPTPPAAPTIVAPTLEPTP